MGNKLFNWTQCWWIFLGDYQLVLAGVWKPSDLQTYHLPAGWFHVDQRVAVKLFLTLSKKEVTMSIAAGGLPQSGHRPLLATSLKQLLEKSQKK